MPNVVAPTTFARSLSWRAPAHDLRRGRAALVDQDDQRQVGPHAVRRDRGGLLLALGVAFDVDGARGKELAGGADGLADVAAWVATEIEDQPVGSVLAHRPKRRLDVLGHAVRELLDPEEARCGTRNDRRRHGIDLDVAAHDLQGPRRAVLARTDRELDRGPRLAADPLDDVADRAAGGGDAVDLEDDVTGSKAGLVGGAVVEHGHHARLVAVRAVELDADPHVRSGQRVVARGAFLRRHEVGVTGVADGVGQAIDRAVCELAVVERVAADVLLVEQVPRLADKPEVVDAVVGRAGRRVRAGSGRSQAADRRLETPDPDPRDERDGNEEAGRRAAKAGQPRSLRGCRRGRGGHDRFGGVFVRQHGPPSMPGTGCPGVAAG